jgi:phosphopantothenoylcysteine decarboxylase/phosphopantothenate--cysteine ligase
MTKSRSRALSNKKAKTLILGVTASVAAYKACELVRLFMKKGYDVKCVMSRDAEWFVTPLSLEALSGNKAVNKMFDLPETREIGHISLAEEADVILVAPATADIISKTAAGICDDILLCTICASKAPVVFAPAMNDNMYNNPIIQDKVKYLSSKGYHFIGPAVGELACGKTGKGHLAPVEEIVKFVETLI